MATLKQQAKLIIEHPFFKQSLENAQNGDFSGFERILMESMLHTWERCSLDASRIYGQFRRANSCDIKKEIRDMPPPTTLDLRLPFVKREIQVTKVKIKITIHEINNQLLIF